LGKIARRAILSLTIFLHQRVQFTVVAYKFTERRANLKVTRTNSTRCLPSRRTNIYHHPQRFTFSNLSTNHRQEIHTQDHLASRIISCPGYPQGEMYNPKSIHGCNRNPACLSAYTDALYNSTALDAAEEDCAHKTFATPHAHHQNTTHALDKKNKAYPVVGMPLGEIGRCTAATSLPASPKADQQRV
ncbi:unnamed protein product, partial [Ectocarpus sp. 6 AP-2014]